MDRAVVSHLKDDIFDIMQCPKSVPLSLHAHFCQREPHYKKIRFLREVGNGLLP
ncbi:hypothetical protein SESBI_05500 [Sesbania bispinosa]|nr:hypothetical protein SESBI_05500 [Sesbania bispinosa]